MRPRELQNDDSRAGKVGSKTVTAGLQRGLKETVRSAFVRNTQKLVQQFGLFGTADPCARLPCVIMTHDAAVADHVLRCRPAFFVWGVARDLADRSPSALWENREALLRDFGRRSDPGGTADRVFVAYERLMRERWGIHHETECHWFANLARLVGVPLEALRFDPTKRRAHAVGAALGAVHDVLVTRFEDMRDLPEIVRGIVPEFAPDFQRVSVREGSRLSAAGAVEARKFRARAARLVAANYTHRFAACDTSRFYPNATRNEV